MPVPDARRPSSENAERASADGDAHGPAATRLARELERAASGERRLQALLEEAHEQIAARDAELDRLRADRDRLYEEAAGVHAHLRAIKRTRVWRVGTTLWLIRDALLRRR